MSIKSSTVKKFFRENFTGENPIQSTTEELSTLKDIIWKRLKEIGNIEFRERSYYTSKQDKEQHILEFNIKNPYADSYNDYGNSFSLCLDNYGKLIISDYYSKTYVSDIEEIVSFIAACQKRFERQNLQKNKRRKVRDFKIQAILAQIKKLAKEEKFDFYTSNDTIKLILFVRFTEKECFELHIPFSKFQEILPNLRSSIISLKELRKMGIKFKIKQIPSYDRDIWIKYDSLE